MKKLLLNILILFFLSYIPVFSQTSIHATARSGCDTLTTRLSLQSSLAIETVRWSFGDGTESTSISPQHKYLNAGKYPVSLIINKKDTLIFPDFIEIGQTPEITITEADTSISGNKYKALTAVQTSNNRPDLNYSWELPDGTTDNSPVFLYKFAAAGNPMVQLMVSNPEGCTRNISQAVSVLTKLEVPNVFSPNQDSKNDLLIIEGDGTTTYTLEIFSRSGIKVFETQAKILVWDGNMFSGEAVRDGIYYYVIQSTDSATKLKQTGFFYLYR